MLTMAFTHHVSFGSVVDRVWAVLYLIAATFTISRGLFNVQLASRWIELIAWTLAVAASIMAVIAAKKRERGQRRVGEP